MAMNEQMGANFVQECIAGKRVDENLKRLFANLQPTVYEIEEYLNSFFERNSAVIVLEYREKHSRAVMNLPPNQSNMTGFTDDVNDLKITPEESEIVEVEVEE